MKESDLTLRRNTAKARWVGAIAETWQSPQMLESVILHVGVPVVTPTYGPAGLIVTGIKAGSLISSRPAIGRLRQTARLPVADMLLLIIL